MSVKFPPPRSTFPTTLCLDKKDAFFGGFFFLWCLLHQAAFACDMSESGRLDESSFSPSPAAPADLRADADVPDPPFDVPSFNWEGFFDDFVRTHSRLGVGSTSTWDLRDFRAFLEDTFRTELTWVESADAFLASDLRQPLSSAYAEACAPALLAAIRDFAEHRVSEVRTPLSALTARDFAHFLLNHYQLVWLRVGIIRDYIDGLPAHPPPVEEAVTPVVRFTSAGLPRAAQAPTGFIWGITGYKQETWGPVPIYGWVATKPEDFDPLIVDETGSGKNAVPEPPPSGMPSGVYHGPMPEVPESPPLTPGMYPPYDKALAEYRVALDAYNAAMLDYEAKHKHLRDRARDYGLGGNEPPPPVRPTPPDPAVYLLQYQQAQWRAAQEKWVSGAELEGGLTGTEDPLGPSGSRERDRAQGLFDSHFSEEWLAKNPPPQPSVTYGDYGKYGTVGKTIDWDPTKSFWQQNVHVLDAALHKWFSDPVTAVSDVVQFFVPIFGRLINVLTEGRVHYRNGQWTLDPEFYSGPRGGPPGASGPRPLPPGKVGSGHYTMWGEEILEDKVDPYAPPVSFGSVALDVAKLPIVKSMFSYALDGTLPFDDSQQEWWSTFNHTFGWMVDTVSMFIPVEQIAAAFLRPLTSMARAAGTFASRLTAQGSRFLKPRGGFLVPRPPRGVSFEQAFRPNPSPIVKEFGPKRLRLNPSLEDSLVFDPNPFDRPRSLLDDPKFFPGHPVLEPLDEAPWAASVRAFGSRLQSAMDSLPDRLGAADVRALLAQQRELDFSAITRGLFGDSADFSASELLGGLGPRAPRSQPHLPGPSDTLIPPESIQAFLGTPEGVRFTSLLEDPVQLRGFLSQFTVFQAPVRGSLAPNAEYARFRSFVRSAHELELVNPNIRDYDAFYVALFAGWDEDPALLERMFSVYSLLDRGDILALADSPYARYLAPGRGGLYSGKPPLGPVRRFVLSDAGVDDVDFVLPEPPRIGGPALVPRASQPLPPDAPFVPGLRPLSERDILTYRDDGFGNSVPVIAGGADVPAVSPQKLVDDGFFDFQAPESSLSQRTGPLRRPLVRDSGLMDDFNSLPSFDDLPADFFSQPPGPEFSGPPSGSRPFAGPPSRPGLPGGGKDDLLPPRAPTALDRQIALLEAKVGELPPGSTLLANLRGRLAVLKAQRAAELAGLPLAPEAPAGGGSALSVDDFEPLVPSAPVESPLDDFSAVRSEQPAKDPPPFLTGQLPPIGEGSWVGGLWTPKELDLLTYRAYVKQLGSATVRPDEVARFGPWVAEFEKTFPKHAAAVRLADKVSGIVASGQSMAASTADVNAAFASVKAAGLDVYSVVEFIANPVYDFFSNGGQLTRLQTLVVGSLVSALGAYEAYQAGRVLLGNLAYYGAYTALAAVAVMNAERRLLGTSRFGPWLWSLLRTRDLISRTRAMLSSSPHTVGPSVLGRDVVPRAFDAATGELDLRLARQLQVNEQLFARLHAVHAAEPPVDGPRPV